jgi:hypothetical protein
VPCWSLFHSVCGLVGSHVLGVGWLSCPWGLLNAKACFWLLCPVILVGVCRVLPAALVKRVHRSVAMGALSTVSAISIRKLCCQQWYVSLGGL